MAQEVKKSGRQGGNRSRISSKHQITIPKEPFREAGLSEGDVLRAEAAGRGRLVLTRTTDLVDELAGSLPPGTFKPGWLEELRREWE